ncbi:uncharacterized protein BXZ73DRAFT_101415 [Epithele typhae]|uniref:uncharacterized protein n=1 Tax=Epithele typhae TaxID=378194 RepID=UPI002008332F|nr:uncharacterized protein BXZ73DRAFT_101415 [Epithele typhae]KAH9932040.1 hypothetical protein BXZ73DRAFT_101415 [Epithele typhae]
MNGTQTARHGRPAPAGPTPPAPAAAPPVPPNAAPAAPAAAAAPAPAPRTANGAATNGAHAPAPKGKKKAAEPQPEEEVLEEEEERRFAEEAQKSVSGMTETAIHAKYIELFAEFKRLERDHAKEKQKLTKDKDAAKGQLTKVNQTKAKMENLARELQKENKKLREDSKRLTTCVSDAQEEIHQMKTDMARRAERAKVQESKYREMPDIVVRVVCKYRAELYFKISRKTKLSRLFNAWTERMESNVVSSTSMNNVSSGPPTKKGGSPLVNGTSTSSIANPNAIQFIFSHGGRSLEHEQTPEEAGIEDGDVILAAEMMDLTDGPGTEEVEEPVRQKLKKEWSENPAEARKTMQSIFDDVVRERLKEVLRQYELRERHFECVVRSKELEVLLSRARAAEQKQLADAEKTRVDKAEEEKQQLRKELDDAQEQQTVLINKLLSFCQEPDSERTRQFLQSLHGALHKGEPLKPDGDKTHNRRAEGS